MLIQKLYRQAYMNSQAPNLYMYRFTFFVIKNLLFYLQTIGLRTLMRKWTCPENPLWYTVWANGYLHFTNDLIHEITKLHSTIERDLINWKEKKFTHVSKRVYCLHKNIIKWTVNYPDRIQDQDEYNELQRELHMDAEILKTAKQMRIQNFYQ